MPSKAYANGENSSSEDSSPCGYAILYKDGTFVIQDTLPVNTADNNNTNGMDDGLQADYDAYENIADFTNNNTAIEGKAVWRLPSSSRGSLYGGEFYANASDRPYNSIVTNVRKVIVIKKDASVAPKSIAFWFAGMTNCVSMDLSELDLSSLSHVYLPETDEDEDGIYDYLVTNDDGYTVVEESVLEELFGSSYASSVPTYRLTYSEEDEDVWGGPNIGHLGFDARGAFLNCSSLVSLVLPSTSSSKGITDTSEMFSGCTSLISLDLSKTLFNTCYSENTFKYCSNLSYISFKDGSAFKMVTNDSFYPDNAPLSTKQNLGFEDSVSWYKRTSEDKTSLINFTNSSGFSFNDNTVVTSYENDSARSLATANALADGNLAAPSGGYLTAGFDYEAVEGSFTDSGCETAIGSDYAGAYFKKWSGLNAYCGSLVAPVLTQVSDKMLPSSTKGGSATSYPYTAPEGVTITAQVDNQVLTAENSSGNVVNAEYEDGNIVLTPGNAGTAEVTLTATWTDTTGNDEGGIERTATTTFRVTVTDSMTSLSTTTVSGSVEYTGSDLSSSVKDSGTGLQVKLGNAVLGFGTDYKVEGIYQDQSCETSADGNVVGAGSYYVKVVPADNNQLYVDSQVGELIVSKKKSEFSLASEDEEAAWPSQVPLGDSQSVQFTYDGDGLMPIVSVEDATGSWKANIEGPDETSDNPSDAEGAAKTYTLTLSLNDVYTGQGAKVTVSANNEMNFKTEDLSFTVGMAPIDLSAENVSLEVEDTFYTGSPVIPSAILKVNGIEVPTDWYRFKYSDDDSTYIAIAGGKTGPSDCVYAKAIPKSGFTKYFASDTETSACTFKIIASTLSVSSTASGESIGSVQLTKNSEASALYITYVGDGTPKVESLDNSIVACSSPAAVSGESDSSMTKTYTFSLTPGKAGKTTIRLTASGGTAKAPDPVSVEVTVVGLNLPESATVAANDESEIEVGYVGSGKTLNAESKDGSIVTVSSSAEVSDGKAIFTLTGKSTGKANVEFSDGAGNTETLEVTVSAVKFVPNDSGAAADTGGIKDKLVSNATTVVLEADKADTTETDKAKEAIGSRFTGTSLGAFTVELKVDGSIRHDDFGNIKLSFPVDKAYIGKKVRVWHHHGKDGSVSHEDVAVTQADTDGVKSNTVGYANITVTDLSTFILEADATQSSPGLTVKDTALNISEIGKTATTTVSTAGTGYTAEIGEGGNLTVATSDSNVATAELTKGTDGAITLTVKGVTPGKATITLTAKGDDTFTDQTTTIEVTVAKKEAALTADTNEMIIEVMACGGQTGTAKITYTGANDVTVASGKLKASSSNPSVATVALAQNADGTATLTVTALKAGSANVTVSAAASGDYDAKSLEIPVKVNTKKTSSLTAVTVETGKSLVYGDVSVKDSTTGAVLDIPVAVSSDTSIVTATVGTDGVLTLNGVKAGTATVTLCSQSADADYTIAVTVKDAGTSGDNTNPDGKPTLSVGSSSVAVEAGDTATVSVDYTGSGTLTATSANANVATVELSSDAKTLTVTGVAAGTTTVTLSADDVDDDVTIKVTVTDDEGDGDDVEGSDSNSDDNGSYGSSSDGTSDDGLDKSSLAKTGDGTLYAAVALGLAAVVCIAGAVLLARRKDGKSGRVSR